VAALLVCAAVTFLAAALGGLASVSAASFYAQLARPAWAPPAWLFGPVWSLLYLLMALAAWLVWRRAGLAGARLALGLYVTQLAANALWSWLFFAWRQGAAASVEVLLLWALVLATTLAFWRISRVAAWLLVPYLAWVSFAAVLTFAIWRRNPQLLG
jgi:benzodiazapine receptor